MIKHYIVLPVDTGKADLLLPEHEHLLNYMEGDMEIFILNPANPKTEFYLLDEFSEILAKANSIVLNTSD